MSWPSHRSRAGLGVYVDAPQSAVRVGDVDRCAVTGQRERRDGGVQLALVVAVDEIDHELDELRSGDGGSPRAGTVGLRGSTL